MVNRLAYQKNPLLFLKITKEITYKFPNIKSIFIGNSPLFQKCQNFIKKNKLENKIFLLGEKNPEEAKEI